MGFQSEEEEEQIAACNGFYFSSHPEVASGRSRPEVASPGPQAGSSGAEPRAIDMIDPGGGLPG